MRTFLKLIKKNSLVPLILTVVSILAMLFIFRLASMAVNLFILFVILFVLDTLIFWGLKGLKKKRAKAVSQGLLLVVNLVVCLLVSIGFLATAMWFYPYQSSKAYQADKTVHNFSEVDFTRSGSAYSGWFVRNTSSSKAPLVIFFGGNGMNSAEGVANFQISHYWSTYKGYNFLYVDFPGYGKSSGSPSEQSIDQMALATYDYAAARSDVSSLHIVVEGYSLGTGTATYLASKRPVDGLILLAPFDRALSMYNATLNIFHGPLTYLASYHFDSMDYAKNVKVRPLIISSTGDQFISYHLSENLAKYFPQKPDFQLLKGFGHNDYLSSKRTQVRSLITNYLQEVLQ